MWTLPRNTWRAIVPPISAAAMLSRKLDSTNTIASSARPPCQPSGRKAGISSGMRLFSKWRERIAKPISSRNRFARITHSCCMCSARPARPGAGLEAGEGELVDDDRGEPGERDLQRACDGRARRRAASAPNRMKSTGMPKTNTGCRRTVPVAVAAAAGAAGRNERAAAIAARAGAAAARRGTDRSSLTGKRAARGAARQQAQGATPSGFQSDIAACGCQRGPAWLEF